MTEAREIIASGSRVVLNRAQLRALVALAVVQGLEPVHKPDEDGVLQSVANELGPKVSLEIPQANGEGPSKQEAKHQEPRMSHLQSIATRP